MTCSSVTRTRTHAHTSAHSNPSYEPVTVLCEQVAQLLLLLQALARHKRGLHQLLAVQLQTASSEQAAHHCVHSPQAQTTSTGSHTICLHGAQMQAARGRKGHDHCPPDAMTRKCLRSQFCHPTMCYGLAKGCHVWCCATRPPQPEQTTGTGLGAGAGQAHALPLDAERAYTPPPDAERAHVLPPDAEHARVLPPDAEPQGPICWLLMQSHRGACRAPAAASSKQRNGPYINSQHPHAVHLTAHMDSRR